MRIWMVVLQTGRAVVVMELTKSRAYDVAVAHYPTGRRPLASSIDEVQPESGETFGDTYRRACAGAQARNEARLVSS